MTTTPTVVVAGDEALVCVAGDLDPFAAARLHEAVVPLVETGLRQVVVDLAGLVSITPIGIAVVVGLADRLAARGGRLVLHTPGNGTYVAADPTLLATILAHVRADLDAA